jgi:hypothetical protein
MAIPRTISLLLLVTLLGAGCALGPAGEVPTRSPTLDYPPPPVQTSDGQVLGADGMRVEDKLRTSPRVGSGGVTPAAAPALIERRPEPSPGEPPDPLCKTLGMGDAARSERCAANAPPRR